MGIRALLEIEPMELTNRNDVNAAMIGKTISRVIVHANCWELVFTDNTSLTIEAVNKGYGIIGPAIVEIK